MIYGDLDFLGNNSLCEVLIISLGTSPQMHLRWCHCSGLAGRSMLLLLQRGKGAEHSSRWWGKFGLKHRVGRMAVSAVPAWIACFESIACQFFVRHGISISLVWFSGGRTSQCADEKCSSWAMALTYILIIQQGAESCIYRISKHREYNRQL